jgi:hypothetical protein
VGTPEKPNEETEQTSASQPVSSPLPPTDQEPALAEKRAAAAKELSRKRWSFAWVATAVIGIVAAGVWLTYRWSEPGAFFSFILLMFSPILLIVILYSTMSSSPARWLSILGITLELWKTYLLLVYTNAEDWKPWADLMSCIAIGVALLLLAFVLWLVRRTIMHDGTQTAIRGYLFATVVGALYLFCHVTYDLTFALALHDRIDLGKGLRSTQPLTEVESTFVFGEGETNLADAVRLSQKVTDWPKDQDAQVVCLVPEYPKNTEKHVLEEAAWNVDQWKRLCSTIRDHDDTWWRITIIGHANDRLPSSGDAWENFDVSQRRTHTVFSFLDQETRAKQVRVEWILRPIANDDSITVREYLPGRDHKLSVEVLMENRVNPSLLDYAYFMIYTITTTGYGDFVPASPRARFIASLANIFEMMFIVVFINVMFVFGSRHN